MNWRASGTVHVHVRGMQTIFHFVVGVIHPLLFFCSFQVSAIKPSFEVGASTQLSLSFGKKTGKSYHWFLSVLLLFVSFHTFTKYFFNTVLTCIHYPVQVLWSLQSCKAVFRLGARAQWPRKIIWVKFRLLVHQLTISALTISSLLRCWQLEQRIVGNAWAVLDPVPEYKARTLYMCPGTVPKCWNWH